MRRTFYLAVGAALGVAATRKTRRAKEQVAASLTPASLAGNVADAIAELGNAVGSFAADVRAGMDERESQLIAVIDEGPGIPRGTEEQLFAPFQRLGDHDTSIGVGLGLSVAHGFVEAMGGTISATDTPGGGLTVEIDLAAPPKDES